MSVMLQLAKFDSALQRGLDNAFAWVFGGKVVPAEIEELLKQEAQDNLVSTEDDRLVAPNMFAVGVSSKDLENLSQDLQLPEIFADQLTRYARNQGWDLLASVVVRIAEESGLRTGQLRVSSYVSAEPEVASGFDAIEHPDAPEQPAVSRPPGESNQNPSFSKENDVTEHISPTSVEAVVNLLLQDGSSRTYQVREGSNIIGRSNDADFRLPDTGVSREHAEITWDGSDAVLVDLESTNGTTVNETPIDNWLLGDGDVITMGHSTIEVRINNPRRG